MESHPHVSESSRVPLHPLIARRWSPRNLDPGLQVSKDELLTVLEAGRVAASWGGTFPVRFLAGLRGDATHSALTELLTRGNRAWAPVAGALVLGAAQNTNAKGELPYAMFDLGLATAQVSLQAIALDLVAHPMAGFDRAGARERFAIPDDFDPLVLIAVGHLGGDEHADETIRERDAKPRNRPDLGQMAFTDRWGTPLE